MSGINYLSQEGYDKLRAELDELKSTGRQEVARAIAEAREKGDLSENAEYDAAKDAQGLLELKINDLEKALANASESSSAMAAPCAKWGKVAWAASPMSTALPFDQPRKGSMSADDHADQVSGTCRRSCSSGHARGNVAAT